MAKRKALTGSGVKGLICRNILPQVTAKQRVLWTACDHTEKWNSAE